MSLVTVSATVKRTINILITLGVCYILILTLKPYIKQGYYSMFPPKDLPTVAFGKVEPLKFVEKKVLNRSPLFELNTTNGKLPAGLPTKAAVIKVHPPQFSFEAGRVAQRNAEALGFLDENLITDLKGDTYAWRNAEFGGVLEIHINKNIFKVSTPLARLSTIYTPGNINKKSAESMAKSILNGLGLFDDNLYQNGRTEIVLGKYYLNRLLEVTIPSEAQLARVDIFRDISGVPIVGPDPKKGQLRMFVGQPSNGNKTLRTPMIEAHLKSIDLTDLSATYPLIPIETAWNEVVSGNGVITNVTPREQSPFEEYTPIIIEKALINDIYVAYYETEADQTYMQPIYVFEGNYTSAGRSGDISVYYPAISGEWVNTPVETKSTSERAR